jgi:hypothetical protein
MLGAVRENRAGRVWVCNDLLSTTGVLQAVQAVMDIVESRCKPELDVTEYFGYASAFAPLMLGATAPLYHAAAGLTEDGTLVISLRRAS